MPQYHGTALTPVNAAATDVRIFHAGAHGCAKQSCYIVETVSAASTLFKLQRAMRTALRQGVEGAIQPAHQ